MNVLIIGRRKKCYHAAQELGHKTYLWSDGPLHDSRKEILAGFIEAPFCENDPQLSPMAIEKAKSFSLDYVVAATESSVNIAAMLRKELGLPGTPVEVSNLMHNKHDMKNMARKHDIPITNYKLIDAATTASDLVSTLGLPLVLKPVADSGARGVVVLKGLEAVKQHMKPGLLAESFVEGSEVSVETLVYNGKPIFHNITDYLHQWKKSILPADIPTSLEKKVILVNDQVIESFGVKNGMTHSEFYLTKNGPVFGEMAVRPPGGYYMELIEEAYAFDAWKAYVQIECGGAEPVVNQKANKFACVITIHPDEGEVIKITGVKEARKIPEVFASKFKLKVGDKVGKQEATSNESGHILLSGQDQEQLLERITLIEQLVQIEVK